MYSKEQASAIKQSFWKTFGQYIALQPSAEGLKINWINYKTGIKHLFFKMTTEDNNACIMIEISHPDAGMRELMFEQFTELKNVLHQCLNEEWTWTANVTDADNRTASRIFKCIPNVTIFRQEDWATLISFFKPRIQALDEFWSMAQYNFDIFK